MAGNEAAEANRRCNHKSRIALLASCAGLILGLSGCIPGPGGVFGGGVDFTLSVSPGSQAVTAGNSIGYVITISQTSGLAPLVQLSVSGLPQGAVAAFNESPVYGGNTSNLVILTAPDTPPGTSHLTI